MERAPVPPVPRAPLIKNLEFKIGALLVATVLLVACFAGYALYVRGAFQVSHKLVLTAEDADSVTIGMPISFSGFPIGKVTRLDLADDGSVRIELAIPSDDARWLRRDSVFTLEKGLLGGAKIKALTADLKAPPLEDGAQRPLQTGDATKEIPVLLERVKSILANVDTMTATAAPINRALGNVETVTQRMAGEYGVLQGVMGSPEKAAEVVRAVDRANTLLASLGGVSLKLDGVLAKADSRLFGQAGIMDQASQAVAKVDGAIGDIRVSLKKLDGTLASAQTAAANAAKITGDTAAATTDLVRLRLEIDDSVLKINHLINELNKKWPFARTVEIQTP
jgi:phospholipid/cholesterol/gamma-HCH transport system substrate-binding protein